jgi:hypothetical protein
VLHPVVLRVMLAQKPLLPTVRPQAIIQMLQHMLSPVPHAMKLAQAQQQSRALVMLTEIST